MLPLAPLQRYGTIVIVGGGCFGSYYLRQLGRAARASALTAERVLIVDRDASCRVAAEMGDEHSFEVELAAEEWTGFFDSYLGAAADGPPSDGSRAPDAIVPSPLMPHLMYEWLARRARARWPARLVETHLGLGLGGAILVCVPVPLADALPGDVAAEAIERAIDEADAAGVAGPALTPWLLARVGELTDGASIRANTALIVNNAGVAGALAVLLSGAVPG